MKKSWLTAAFVAGLALSAGVAQSAVTASDLAAMHLDIVDCRKHDPAQESADMDLVNTALPIMQQHDLAKLDSLMPALRAALAHAPDMPSQPEHCGDALVLYSDDPTALFALTGAISSNAAMGAKTVEQREALPYGILGFIVGWIEYEHKDYAAAAVDYAKGLRNNPEMAAINSEYALTLSQLGRNEEAVKAVDAFLTAYPGADKGERANLLRKKGYALVEMGRLDEAEATYKDSLALEDNDTTRGELDYIAQQRASKPKT